MKKMWAPCLKIMRNFRMATAERYQVQGLSEHGGALWDCIVHMPLKLALVEAIVERRI